MRTSAEQKELILKLEHDLTTIQAMASLPRPDAEGSELSGMGYIPEPIKEATAMFSGEWWDLRRPEKKAHRCNGRSLIHLTQRQEAER